MAKDGKKKKVKSRSSTKYATSSDEDNSSDDEDNLLTLFANLNIQQKEKLNDMISAIHEKDELLDSQEDFLIKENKKHVKVKNAYALKVEKCENLTSELSTCHDTISSLRNENAKLIAKVEKSNVCEQVTICTRCRDINVDAIHDHLALIKKQNDHIAQLSAKNNEHGLENENFKFARSMLYNGRRPGIKDGIGFQQVDNVKLNAPPKGLSNFVKGKAPMPQDNDGYILYPTGYPEHKIRRIHSRKSHSGSHHAFMYKSEASSSRQTTCHTRVSGHQDPGANIITRCAGTKSHTYDESWHMIECHIFTI
jgi:hypothetical protein